MSGAVFFMTTEHSPMSLSKAGKFGFVKYVTLFFISIPQPTVTGNKKKKILL